MDSEALLVDQSRSAAQSENLGWLQTIAVYSRANLRKSLCQIANTFIPYFILWVLMIGALRREYPYWITLMLASVAGGILVRIFILFHDCCHGSFFSSRAANTILGYVAGILTFTAFEDWRYSHNRHHATAGDLDRRGVGDIWTMTAEEYLAAPRLKRMGYRVYRNPLVLFGPGAVLLFLWFQRFSKKGAGKSARKSVVITNLALLSLLALAAATIGVRAYLMIQLPVIAIGGGAGLWLFYIQHQFEDAYWVGHDEWNPLSVALHGSSYFKLPKVLQWFTGNIGLHHVHHVRPSIPNYNLQQCYDEVPVLQAVRAITLKGSIGSLGLSLYDEKNRKLVGFSRVKKRSRLHASRLLRRARSYRVLPDHALMLQARKRSKTGSQDPSTA